MRIYEGSTEVILDSLAKKLVKDLASAMIIDAHMHVWPDHIADAMQSQRPSGHDRCASTASSRACSAPWTRPASTRACALGVGIEASRSSRAPTSSSAPCRATASCPWAPCTPTCRSRRTSRSLKDNGIVGVKLHPLFQALSLSDPAGASTSAAALAEEGMPVISHVGSGGDERGQRARQPGGAAAARRRPARPDADRLPLRRLPPARRGRGARRRLAGDPRDVVAAHASPTSTRSGWWRSSAGTAPTASSSARTGRWPTRPPRSRRSATSASPRKKRTGSWANNLARLLGLS